ncbi:MAG TPA: DUF523 and DUF1722 domain-containing protein, partial [Candidatus Sumerlaeota bacterium]|nr:DUF523 and DUF1722 domain-containing protein [Candidatus Sumerlaeota bacterium]
MNAFPRPVVVVSKCLGFAACRYNGECLPDVFVERMKPYVEFRPVCPEMEIGLGVPRDPIRVVLLNNELRLIQPSTGKDVTDKMRQFADSFISGVSEADGFLLKSRSPSCGINSVKVYPGLGKAGAILQKGKGFFAGVVRERLPLTPLEEEGRLYDFGIRGHYLARLFAFARFREIIRKPAMKKLVEFHNNNELLLMANHQKEMRALEKIAANHENNPLENVVAEYGAHLRLALAAPSRRAAEFQSAGRRTQKVCTVDLSPPTVEGFGELSAKLAIRGLPTVGTRYSVYVGPRISLAGMSASLADLSDDTRRAL